MTVFNGMDADTLETMYNVRAALGDGFQGVVDSFMSRSAAHREAASVRLDLAYGEGARERLDFFSGGDVNGPAVLFIHGGYWQRGDKEMYSFVTEACVKHGVSVAVVNYDLTPAVRMPKIPPQIRKAVAWTWKNANDLGFSRDKFTVMGHSAGGHLTAMMMATDWPAYDSALPAEMIHAAVPISGLFELEPLVHTSINDGPQMDVAEAIQESPIFMPPVTNAPQLVVVGGAESTEFHRQSDEYCAKYTTGQRAMERYTVPGANHMLELEALADDASVLFEKSMGLIAG